MCAYSANAASNVGISRPTVDSHLLALYPKGNNYLVCPLSLPSYLKQAGSLEVKVCDPSGIVKP